MPESNYQTTINYNPYLFRVLLKYLKPKNNDNILDLGCGRGFYIKKMEDYTERVVGIDISQNVLNKAVTLKVKYGDATNLNFETDTFDKIYSLHTIEHVPYLNQFLGEAARVLKPGGTMVLVYPWEPIRGIRAIGAAIKTYNNPFVARKIHLHKLTPKKIRRLLKNNDIALSHIESKLIFALGFDYLTVLKKPAINSEDKHLKFSGLRKWYACSPKL